MTGETLREWTPLHIACWGTVKPQYDREIVEAILVAALKAGKDTEQAVRAAKDAQSGETPLDLAKQRRENVEANPPKPGADDKDWLDEKCASRSHIVVPVATHALGCLDPARAPRASSDCVHSLICSRTPHCHRRKLDKIIEWIEKGLPAGS